MIRCFRKFIRSFVQFFSEHNKGFLKTFYNSKDERKDSHANHDPVFDFHFKALICPALHEAVLHVILHAGGAAHLRDIDMLTTVAAADFVDITFAVFTLLRVLVDDLGAPWAATHGQVGAAVLAAQRVIFYLFVTGGAGLHLIE